MSEISDNRKRLEEAAKGVVVDKQELIQKLYKKLEPSGWGNKLKGFMLSKEFEVIIDRLIKDKEEGKRFVPSVKYMFRAFEECPASSSRVVFLGQDPYPYVGVPDGLAFSCSFSGRPQPSLKYMFDEIKSTVYKNGYYEEDVDLIRWANQGVLLLNTAFTVNEKQPGTHYLLWRPFLVYVIDSIIYDPKMADTIFVFLGNKAKAYAELIPDNFLKIETTHPASAAHNNLEKWDSGDIFNKVNKGLKKLGQTEIVW